MGHRYAARGSGGHANERVGGSGLGCCYLRATPNHFFFHFFHSFLLFFYIPCDYTLTCALGGIYPLDI